MRAFVIKDGIPVPRDVIKDDVRKDKTSGAAILEGNWEEKDEEDDVPAVRSRPSLPPSKLASMEIFEEEADSNGSSEGEEQYGGD